MVAIVRELRHRISGNDLLVPCASSLARHEKGNPRRPCLPQVNEKIASTALKLFREKSRSARSAYDPRSLRSEARIELRPSSEMRIRRARWLVQKRRHVSHPMASSFATGTSHQLVCGGRSVASVTTCRSCMLHGHHHNRLTCYKKRNIDTTMSARPRQARPTCM